jgi:hypothetical protein
MKYDFVKCGIVTDSGKLVIPDEARISNRKENLMENEIKFEGIVKEIRVKALVSLDKSARILIETPDLRVLEVGTWPADETVIVVITRNPK